MHAIIKLGFSLHHHHVVNLIGVIENELESAVQDPVRFGQLAESI